MTPPSRARALRLAHAGVARSAAIAATALCLGSLSLLSASPAAAEQGFLPTTTSLSVTPPQALVGETVTLSATVQAAGALPEGEVAFAANYTTEGGEKRSVLIGGVALSPLSGSPGVSHAELSTASFAPGSYAITATYKCGGWSCFELESSASAPTLLSVSETKIYNTRMQLAAEPGKIVTGQPERFVAKVSEREGSAVPSGTVTFDDNGTLMGTSQLDGEGVARFSHSGFVAGTNEITASYEGDKTDHSVSATIVLEAPEETHVVQTDTTVTASPNPVIAGHDVTLVATVAQSGTSTAPPAGAEVTFTANGVYLGEAELGADGTATLVHGGWLAGSYEIKASYVGDLTDSSSSGKFELQVNPPTVLTANPPSPTVAPTSIHADVSGPLPQGVQVTLAGTLLDSETGTPVRGQALTLSLGEQSCLTGPTDASGKASCAVTATGPLGPSVSRASFAGTSLLASSNDSEPALLYAFAQGGGAFVVGDESAATGSRAMFWGARWWKNNVLSAGPTPAAFKGFAADLVVPVCGAQWSTRPGNSPPPPAGPLPAYMAVIVTGSVAQSGPAISGTVEHIVVVAPNQGYASDPGHAGTGAIVATVC